MKTPIQKGKIIANPPTMKTLTVEEKIIEDSRNRVMRREGKIMELKIPKQR